MAETKPVRFQIACGKLHTILVTDSGELWGFGGNKWGQLGAKVASDTRDPVRVDDGFDNDGSRSLKGKRVVQVATGDFHTACLTASGEVYTWGLEAKGRLGHVDTWGMENKGESTVRPRNPNLPCLVRAFMDKAYFPTAVRLKQVACGSDSTIAVDDAGDVYTWGLGNFGNLGHGDTADQLTPRVVETLRGMLVTTADMGAKHSVACTAKGDVYTWGHGDNGRLGNGERRGTLVPEPIQTLEGVFVARVAAGESHCAAVTEAGALLTWGTGASGRLGHGDEQDAYAPRPVDALQRAQVVLVACGAFHTMVVTSAGEVYGWGGGQYGRIGHGTEFNTETPRPVVTNLNTKRVTQVACGTFHTCIVTEDGGVFTAGFGGHGRLGHGDLDSRLFPTSVQLMQSRGVTGTSSSLLREGEDAEDAMVDADTRRLRAEARQHSPIMIATGAQHSMALTYGGSVIAWGEGEHGQLGLASFDDAYTPTLVKGALITRKVVRIAAGSQHSFAVTGMGELFAWGRGLEGQLGTGHTRDEDRPVHISALSGRRVVDAAAGEYHSACIVDNGAVMTWGAGNIGKLGHGRGTQTQALPRMIRGPLAQHAVAQVSLGSATSAVVTDSGAVYTWGGGWFGRLGLGSTDNVYTPQRVMALQYRVIRQVSCGTYHTLFRTDDGEVFACGRGDARLGIRGAGNTLEPQLVMQLKIHQVNTAYVHAADAHSVAIATNGNVWVWGKGQHGKLGTGMEDDAEVPIQLNFHDPDDGPLPDHMEQGRLNVGVYDAIDRASGDKDTRAAAGFSNHTMLIDRTSTIYVFGNGGSGRLGNGKTDNLLSVTKLKHDLLPVVDEGDLPEIRSRKTAAGASGKAPTTMRAAGVAEEAYDVSEDDEDDSDGEAEDEDRRQTRADAQELLTLFRVRDSEQGPPMAAVQMLLAREPRAHSVRKIRTGVEALLAIRSHALGLLSSCKSLEEEVKAVEHKIQVTIASTVRKTIPSKAGPPTSLRIPFDVQDNQQLFERAFSMFLANPMYLTNVYKTYIGINMDPDLVLDVDDPEEEFVNLSLAVYGDMAEPRNERMFLVLLDQVLQEEVNASTAHTLSRFVLEFGHESSVFGRFVTHYFRRDENMVILRNLFSEAIKDFLDASEDGQPLNLNYDPIAVYNGIVTDPRHRRDDAAATDSERLALYNDPGESRVREEVNARVGNLLHIAQDWFARIVRAMQGLPFGVRWISRRVHRHVVARFQVGDEDSANFTFFIGNFIVDKFIRRAIQFPKRSGLLPRTAKLTTVQNMNLTLLVSVLRHMASGNEFNAETPWLKSLNASINKAQKQAKTMVMVLTNVHDDLSHDLVVDTFNEHLRTTPLVHPVKLNQILYLRALLARDLTAVVTKQADPLEHLAKLLFPSDVHQAKARDYIKRVDEEDYGINLTIETRFEEFPEESPMLCPITNVPLPAFLAPPDARRLDMSEMFNIDDTDERKVCFRESLREPMGEVSNDADLEWLKKILSARQSSAMKLGQLDIALNLKKAMEHITLMETRSRNAGALLMVELLEGIDERASKASRLEMEQFTFETLKSDIHNFRQRLVAKQAALVQYLKVLRKGVGREQNRTVVSNTAARSKAGLTPDNLVRATHKTGSVEKTKLQLDEEDQILGAYAKFKYADLVDKEVAKEIILPIHVQREIDPLKLAKHVSVCFVAREDGTFDVTMLVNNDTVIDAFQLHIDELTKLERSIKHDLVPTRPDGSQSKIRFNVPSLLNLLTTELTARRLVLR